MNKNLLAYVALGLSLLACVLAVAALSAGPSAPKDGVAAAAPGNANDQRLVDELAKARADLDRLTEEVRSAALAPIAVERAPAQPDPSPQLLERLSALEKLVAQLQEQGQERAQLAKPASTAAGGLTDAQRTATDLRASEKDRLAALAALRGQKVDGVDALSSNVVLSMIDMAERSQDENTRNDVYRNLHGVNDSALRDSMLRALANDSSAKVRERAARDIDTFLADALVQNALRAAADGDADLAVRSAALKTLSGKH